MLPLKRDLGSGADILEREIISHHVLLTAMCWNFFVNRQASRDDANFSNAKKGPGRGIGRAQSVAGNTEEMAEDVPAIFAVMLGLSEAGSVAPQ
jgi:hypothetical protein